MDMTTKIEAEIVDYDFGVINEDVFVEMLRGCYSFAISIPKIEFETFLKIDGKLEWQMNLIGSGSDVQKEGIMSCEEYWDTSKDDIKKDLLEYIITKLFKFS